MIGEKKRDGSWRVTIREGKAPTQKDCQKAGTGECGGGAICEVLEGREQVTAFLPVFL